MISFSPIDELSRSETVNPDAIVSDVPSVYFTKTVNPVESSVSPTRYSCFVGGVLISIPVISTIRIEKSTVFSSNVTVTVLLPYADISGLDRVYPVTCSDVLSL